MKRHLILSFFLTFICPDVTTACCIGNHIGIFPRDSNISENAVFLINFDEKDFVLKNEINNMAFTAITSKGKRFKLTVLKTNFSGSMGQVLLKVVSKLKIGDSISIQVTFLNKDSLPGKIKYFASIVSLRTWAVKFQADNEIPNWTNDAISYTTHDSRNSSAPGYSVVFNSRIVDNGYSTLPVFYEVKLNNQKFICSADGSSPGIYYSICGSNFNFGIDQSYTASVKAIDASGNFTLQDKTLEFTTKSQPELIMEDQNVGILFINAYAKFCNNRKNSNSTLEWINENQLITDNFKLTYNALIKKAKKNDPEIGLDFDPIFDAQDYPVKGFEFESMDPNSLFMIAKGVDWKDYHLVLKIVFFENKWLVDGSGAINIPDDKRSNR